MLYGFLKIVVRIAAIIFCRKIVINKPEMVKLGGPLLIASNHPNSYLDAVIIDILFAKPVWSLARGDAFFNRNINKILGAFRILPIYRTSEGVENLSSNYQTFDACIDIFQRGGIVQIFSEGQCVNEWHLRPLKKGTARLANKAWDNQIPLNILPVALNYSSFTRFGKNIFVNFGNIIASNRIDLNSSEGVRNQQFNTILEDELKQLVFEIDRLDTGTQEMKLKVPQSRSKKILLFLPAIVGWVIHAPFYILVKMGIKYKHKNTGHYDSLLITLLVFCYPVYLLLIILFLYSYTHSVWVSAVVLIAPFTAWAYTQLKKQLD